MSSTSPNGANSHHDEDTKQLHSMGYAQELAT